LKAYAMQAKDATLTTQATEIRIRAERRAGGLLIEMAARKERDSGKGNRNPIWKSHAATAKLRDLGINKTQSSRWQKLAALDPDQFEDRVEAATKRAYDRIAQRLVKEADIERAQRRHRKLVEHGCTAEDLVALAAPGKRFPVIYADPPWEWETWGGAKRQGWDCT
jgi:hypothetical protein